MTRFRLSKILSTRLVLNITLVLFIAFSLRAALTLAAYLTTHRLEGFYSYDSSSYIQPAQGLLETGQFVSQGKPEIYRTPGYPLFLIPGIWSGKLELVTLLLQLLLGVLNVYLVYQIGLVIFSNYSVALASSLLMAFEPLAILYGSKLLSETLFSSALLLFTLFIARYLRTYKRRDLLCGAILLAITVYIRPISYYLPVLIFCFLAIRAFINRKKIRPQFVFILSFFMISFGLIGLWQLRNAERTGYGGFSSISDYNLYYFYGASISAVNEHIPLYDMQNQTGYRDENIYFQIHPEQKDWSLAQRLSYMKSAGTKLILDNLPLFIKLYIIGLGRTSMDPGANEYLRLFGVYNLPAGIFGVGLDRGIGAVFSQVKAAFTQYPYILYSNLFLFALQLVYYFSALAGLVKSKAWNSSLLILPLLIGIYLWALSGGANGADRFRMPVMPYITLFAGYGIYFWVTSIKLRKPGAKLKPSLSSSNQI